VLPLLLVLLLLVLLHERHVPHQREVQADAIIAHAHVLVQRPVILLEELQQQVGAASGKAAAAQQQHTA
jgi:hypothetical protein